MIELLVASAMTALMAGLMLALVGNVLNNWSRTHGNLMAEVQANRALDQLALDLKGALYRDDGRTWLAASVQANASVSAAWVAGGKPIAQSLDPAAAVLTDARFGLAGVWLRFFTTRQGADIHTNDSAAPIAVAYQVIRRPPAPGGQQCHYMLYRSEVSPSATIAAGYDLNAAPYTTGSSTDGAAGTVVSPGVNQVIADNVIDFGVRIYGYARNSATGAPELTNMFPIDAANLEYAARAPPSGVSERFPIVVDIVLRVLTDEGARQIAALEDNRIAGDWWKMADVHSRIFTRRVMLSPNPP